MTNNQFTPEDLILFYNHSNQFMGVIALDGVILFANQTALSFIDKAPEEIEGCLFWDTPWWDHDPVLQEKLKQTIFQVTKTGQQGSLNVEHIHVSGVVHYFYFTLRPIFDSNNTLIYLLAEGKDITDLHHAEQESYNAIQRYKDLFENSADAFLILEGNRFIDVNHTTLNMLGYDHEEELFQVHPSSISPEFQPDGRASVEKAEAMIALAIEKGSHRFEWVHLKKDGSEINVEIVLTPIRSGEKTLIFVTWRSIEDRLFAQREVLHLNAHLESLVETRTRALKEAMANLEYVQKELVETQKNTALSQMLLGISHEMNTPIGNAFTAVSYLNQLVEMAAETNECIDMGDLSDALALITRNLTLAIQLIDFFKQNSTEMTTEPQTESNLLAIVNAAIENPWYKPLTNSSVLLSEFYKQPEIKYIIHIDSETTLMTSPKILQSVFGEIIRNAFLHGFHNARKGTITIIHEEHTDTHRITITDDGVGMDQETLQHIFEPFFTIRRSRNNAGLGLSLVYNQVRHILGGKITAESLPDKGTCFTIVLTK